MAGIQRRLAGLRACMYVVGAKAHARWRLNTKKEGGASLDKPKHACSMGGWLESAARASKPAKVAHSQAKGVRRGQRGWQANDRASAQRVFGAVVARAASVALAASRVKEGLGNTRATPSRSKCGVVLEMGSLQGPAMHQCSRGRLQR